MRKGTNQSLSALIGVFISLIAMLFFIGCVGKVIKQEKTGSFEDISSQIEAISKGRLNEEGSIDIRLNSEIVIVGFKENEEYMKMDQKRSLKEKALGGFWECKGTKFFDIKKPTKEIQQGCKDGYCICVCPIEKVGATVSISPEASGTHSVIRTETCIDSNTKCKTFSDIKEVRDEECNGLFIPGIRKEGVEIKLTSLQYEFENGILKVKEK